MYLINYYFFYNYFIRKFKTFKFKKLFRATYKRCFSFLKANKIQNF